MNHFWPWPPSSNANSRPRLLYLYLDLYISLTSEEASTNTICPAGNRHPNDLLLELGADVDHVIGLEQTSRGFKYISA
jgi:hypothetical protein